MVSRMRHFQAESSETAVNTYSDHCTLLARKCMGSQRRAGFASCCLGTHLGHQRSVGQGPLPRFATSKPV